MTEPGLFLSWVGSHGRSRDLAHALGLAEVNYPERVQRLPVPIRYAVAALWTAALLVRRRPACVVVMSPPPVPVLLAAAYCLSTDRLLVVDAHSGAFNRQAWRPLTRLSLRLLDRCRRGAVVVTNDEMRAEAEAWTRHPVVELHDLLPEEPEVATAAHSCDAFVVSSWAGDEPLGALAAAMPLLHGLRVVVSGRPPTDAARAELEAAGVLVPGFLSDEEYARTLAGAGVVVALTTREGTMQRGGYEAAAAGKALVVSDTRVLREYFGPAAVYAPAEPLGLAAAVRAAVGCRSELEAEMRALRGRRQHLEHEGLRRLRALLVEP